MYGSPAIRDAATGVVSVDMLSQVCTHLVEDEAYWYPRPSIRSFFGMPDGSQPPFDFTKRYAETKKELIDLWFKPHNAVLYSKSLPLLKRSAKFNFELYEQVRSKANYEANKERIDEIGERIKKHRQEKYN